ncbi:MAG: ABC transporter permease [Lachnospiraceae bacterium]|nr:ABC transporter permease [Lachnospiraceae bacterium]
MSAVFKRELKSYFDGMTGYFFAAFLIFLTGLYTMIYNFKNLYPYFEYVIYELCFFYLIAIPILTMKVIAEDKKQKTDQLLYSLPLSMIQIVMGKFMAMAVMLLLPVGVMGIIPLILRQYGTINMKTAYGSLFAFYLLGCALIAIGLFLSSLTENQIVAAVMCFFTILICYIAVGLSNYVPTDAFSSYIAFAVMILIFALVVFFITKSRVTGLICAVVGEAALGVAYFLNKTSFDSAFQKVLLKCSLFERLMNFINGMFDMTTIIYYLSVIFLFLFFTVQVMEKRRWN